MMQDGRNTATGAPGRVARAWMSLLALSIIYGNVSVIFNSDKLGLSGWPSLPRPFAVHDAFLIPGMFSGYATYNFDFVLWAQRSDRGRASDRGEWFELPLQEHFPLRYPLVYTELFAAHQWDMLGPGAQREAWAVLSSKIKANHNRLHPDAPVARLQIGTIDFPLSPLGYRGAKAKGRTWTELWYSDP